MCFDFCSFNFFVVFFFNLFSIQLSTSSTKSVSVFTLYTRILHIQLKVTGTFDDFKLDENEYTVNIWKCDIVWIERKEETKSTETMYTYTLNDEVMIELR